MIQTGRPRHSRVMRCPGSSLETSACTGAPAALALALGCREATKGTATPTAPTAPTTVVAPTRKRRRFLFTPLSAISRFLPSAYPLIHHERPSPPQPRIPNALYSKKMCPTIQGRLSMTKVEGAFQHLDSRNKNARAIDSGEAFAAQYAALNAWRTAGDDAPCADRPSSARPYGRRGSRSRLHAAGHVAPRCTPSGHG